MNLKFRTFAVISVLAILFLAVASLLVWKKDSIQSALNLPAPSSLPQEEKDPRENSGNSTPAAPSTGPRPAIEVAYKGEPVAALKADPAIVGQIGDARFRSVKAELAELASSLEKNPLQPEAWMRVAYIKHFFNDDAGARDAYEFLNVIAEGDSLPFYNLALIYGYNLKEPAKAEVKFKAALERNPNEESYFIGLADFYREVRRDFPAAIRTLTDGTSRLPKGVNLLTSLGSLYRETGDIPKAIEYYEKARSSGLLASGELAAVEAELERLKKLQ